MAIGADPSPDTRFRLRTLFIATAMCAMAFAAMVRWRNGLVWMLAGGVPAIWLGVGLLVASNILRRSELWIVRASGWLLASSALFLIVVALELMFLGATFGALALMAW